VRESASASVGASVSGASVTFLRVLMLAYLRGWARTPRLAPRDARMTFYNP
jgi:hypothetical protein